MQRNVQYIKFQLNFSLVNVPYTCWVLIDISAMYKFNTIYTQPSIFCPVHIT